VSVSCNCESLSYHVDELWMIILFIMSTVYYLVTGIRYFKVTLSKDITISISIFTYRKKLQMLKIVLILVVFGTYAFDTNSVQVCQHRSLGAVVYVSC